MVDNRSLKSLLHPRKPADFVVMAFLDQQIILIFCLAIRYLGFCKHFSKNGTSCEFRAVFVLNARTTALKLSHPFFHDCIGWSPFTHHTFNHRKISAPFKHFRYKNFMNARTSILPIVIEKQETLLITSVAYNKVFDRSTPNSMST